MRIIVRLFFTTFDVDCIDELKSLLGDKAPSYSTVKICFNEFDCGRRSLKEIRKGRPKTAVVSENIDAVR